MSVPRFFVPGEAIRDGCVRLPESAAYHTRAVLRLRAGDAVTVFDGGGCEWPAALTRVDSQGVEARLGAASYSCVESACRVTLLQALIRPERFEFALQKATELGVWGFVPVVSSRVQSTDVRAAAGASRLARWRRIVQSAAEQSGRLMVPRIEDQVGLGEGVARAASEGPVVFLWEEEGGAGLGLRSALRGLLEGGMPGRLAIVIGPVGGFAAAEVEDARRAGAVVAGMGRRVLRSETASVAAVAAAMFELGELGL